MCRHIKSDVIRLNMLLEMCRRIKSDVIRLNMLLEMCRHIKSDVVRLNMLFELSRSLFYSSRYWPCLNYCPKIHGYCCGHRLGKVKLKSSSNTDVLSGL